MSSQTPSTFGSSSNSSSSDSAPLSFADYYLPQLLYGCQAFCKSEELLTIHNYTQTEFKYTLFILIETQSPIEARVQGDRKIKAHALLLEKIRFQLEQIVFKNDVKFFN
jgi:hypothetical protein